MRFRQFYMLENKSQQIFQKTFDKWYDKGFYGEVDRETLRESQRAWFEKFITFIESKNMFELGKALLNTENKVTREWFSEITGFNVKFLSNPEAEKVLAKFLEE